MRPIRVSKCIKYLILMSLMVWIFITMTDRYLPPTNSYSRLSRPEGKRTLIEEIQRNNKTFVILFWTKYFLESIETHFNETLMKSLPTIDSAYCSHIVPHLRSSCVVTSDRAYLTFSKALLFHWRDLNIEDLPQFRRSDQLWSIYNLEAPTHTNTLNDDRLAFNITATYRTDSDIHVPYGRIVPKSHYSNDNSKNMKIDFDMKSKQIVWFVSNCETPSKRELYVRQLSRYIEVDIYGKCGPLSCVPARSQHCLQKAAKEYKFYLSFENSICRDYVTEKLFEALNYDIIPVVFGGSNYKSWMPHNSYIDANNMTPRQLARTLSTIANNRHKYLSYFEWKHNYRAITGLDRKFEVFCKLCYILNEQKTYRSRSAQEINDWWHKRADCKPWISQANDS